MKRPQAPIPVPVSIALSDHQAGFKGQDIQAAVILCQSTTGTATWLNRLVNKHHTHTGRELGCGAAAGGAHRRFGPRLFSTPLSLPPPAAPWIARPNLQLHQSPTRLTAPHKLLCPRLAFSPSFSPPSLSPTHSDTLCFCLTLSLGSAHKQHRHRGGGDSSDGKTQGSFLSSPGVSPPFPPLLFLALCLCAVCLLLELGPHRCSKPHPSSLAVMSTFAHSVLANNLPTVKMCLALILV